MRSCVSIWLFQVELAEKRFKEVLKLEEDLSHVKEASKVSMKELENDMTQLRNNLKEVSREIEFQRVQPLVPGDRFLPVMKEFLTSATCRLSEIEDLFQDMKTRVRNASSNGVNELKIYAGINLGSWEFFSLPFDLMDIWLFWVYQIALSLL